MVTKLVVSSSHVLAPPSHSAVRLNSPRPLSSSANSVASDGAPTTGLPRLRLRHRRRGRELPHAATRSRVAAMAFASSTESPLLHDAVAAALTAGVALGLLRFWEELAKRGVFEQKLSRKLVHISIGLAFLLFWPLFSSGVWAPYLAALAPGINIFRMLLLGLGIWKNDAMVKSMSRYGHHSELLQGPLYYACTITLSTSIFWRTSPLAVAAICNLCAGDGMADIIGRRFGREKLPYNPNKSIVGSIAMCLAGFIASIGYMHYFHIFGLMEESWSMIRRFFLVSVATAIVESLPVGEKLDDNLTVPLTSLLVGGVLF